MDVLGKRWVDIQPTCPIYNGGEESLVHLFVQCHFARSVWILTQVGWQYLGVQDIIVWFTNVFQSANTDLAKEILVMLWALWTARN